MPKKRRKNRKASQKRAAARSPHQHAHLEPDDWDDALEEDYDPLGSLTERYPAPADAVKAFQAGAPVEWVGSIDGAMMRHRVVLADNGEAVIEQAIFLHSTLEQSVVCAAYQAEDAGQEQFRAGVLAALAILHSAIRPVLEADVREARPDYIAAVLEPFHEAPEPTGPGTPVFGWRTTHSVGPDTTWEDTIDTAAWNSSLTMTSYTQYADDLPQLQPPQLSQLLREHGVPVILCANCGWPITDRHPRWSGVWVSPSGDGGPLCEPLTLTPTPAFQAPEPRLGWTADAEFGHPHRPAHVGLLRKTLPQGM